MGKKPTEERAKEEDRAQILRLCLESLVVVLMVAFVFGVVVSLGRHMMVATETHRTNPQTAGRLVAYVDTEGRVNWAQEGVNDLCAVLAPHKGKVIEVNSLKQEQGLGGEGVHCDARYLTLGGSTRVPGGGH